MAALPDRLAAQIAHAFPTLQWNSAQLLDHGWDHEVVTLDSTLVLRFPRTHEYQERLHDEIRLLDALTPLLHVRIPKYTRSAAGVAGYTIVHGQELRHKNFWALSPMEQKSLALHLASFLTTLHCLDASVLSAFTTPVNNPMEAALTHHKRLEDILPLLTSDHERCIARRLVEELLEHSSTPLPQYLTHGDLTSDHILLDPGDPRPGIIDFSDRAIDDPAHDFAGLHEYGAAFVQEVYAHYEGLRDNTLLDRALLYYQTTGLTHLFDSMAFGHIPLDQARKAFRTHVRAMGTMD